MTAETAGAILAYAPRRYTAGPRVFGAGHRIGADGAPVCGWIVPKSWTSAPRDAVTCPGCRRAERIARLARDRAAGGAS